MSNQVIEKRLLRYLPKQILPYVVWLDSEKTGRNQYVYWLVLEKDGTEINAEPCDSVSELRYAGKQLIPYIDGSKKWDPDWN